MEHLNIKEIIDKLNKQEEKFHQDSRFFIIGGEKTTKLFDSINKAKKEIRK